MKCIFLKLNSKLVQVSSLKKVYAVVLFSWYSWKCNFVVSDCFAFCKAPKVCLRILKFKTEQYNDGVEKTWGYVQSNFFSHTSFVSATQEIGETRTSQYVKRLNSLFYIYMLVFVGMMKLRCSVNTSLGALSFYLFFIF